MDRVQLSQGYGATSRRQFIFYHHVFMNSWYSFYQPQMDERLSWPRTNPVVFLLGAQRLGIQFLNHQAIAPCVSPNKQKPQKRKLYLLCYNTLIVLQKGLFILLSVSFLLNIRQHSFQHLFYISIMFTLVNCLGTAFFLG